jgi:hypothetical protein
LSFSSGYSSGILTEGVGLRFPVSNREVQWIKKRVYWLLVKEFGPSCPEVEEVRGSGKARHPLNTGR